MRQATTLGTFPMRLQVESLSDLDALGQEVRTDLCQVLSMGMASLLSELQSTSRGLPFPFRALSPSQGQPSLT